jgi:DNA repair protein RadA/Sms
MLSAVTEKYGRVKLYDKDTFLATVGGMKITEPAADLAICLALLSTVKDSAFPSDAVAIGEVTLSGDIRRARNARQRLAEAARLGYKKAFVPVGTEKQEGIIPIPVKHLTDMLKLFVNQQK